jgi:hypothetical protein
VSDDDDTGRVTRLGPDSGGDLPHDAVRSRSWTWSSSSLDGRWTLPFWGVFLVAFGVLLFLEQAVPGTSIWSWLALAAGAASLIVGANRRSAGLIQLGVLLLAVGLPSLLEALGLISGPGWGTIFLGVALIGIGLARRRDRIGWQVWVGVVLLAIGGAERYLPNLDQLILPLAIVIVGGIIIARAMTARRPG